MITKPLHGAEKPEPVRDTAGNLVRNIANYFILPSSMQCGTRCGIALLNTNKTCPLDVVKEDEAMQFSFVPFNFKKAVIRVSTDLNVIHSFPTNCSTSFETVWKVDKIDAVTRQRFVTTGGVRGNPGRETVDNWFKIERFESGYKFVFCPKVCEECEVVCKDVGIFLDENRFTRFVLSDFAFGVKFKKACCE
ncbi:hypothetical protein TSUD_174030 [Trifolium subterraneum]|nr:hypothetical protein TSUD_174030 [Trifolium subterraneum]